MPDGGVSVSRDDIADAEGQDFCFSGAGAGDDHDGAFDGVNGEALVGVEGGLVFLRKSCYSKKAKANLKAEAKVRLRLGKGIVERTVTELSHTVGEL